MKKSTRLFIALVALVMVLGIFTSCKATDNTTPQPTQQADTGESAGDAAGTEETAAPSVDISKKVDLLVYTMGASQPLDMEMVLDKANEILLDKLNCTVDVQVMTDWPTRYKLVLSSNEPVDLIWTAMWYSYQPYAYDGAWMDITTMVDEVTPQLRDIIGQDTWDMCKIEGKDYAIPTLNQMYAQWGVAWREDLRKKYDCPEITDWESMEAYADAILANEPGMIPFCDSRSGGLWHSFSEKTHSYAGLGNPQFSYGLAVKTDNPRDLYIFHETDQFKEYCLTERKWVENGYVQPDVASSTDTGNAGMLSGKYAGSINTQGIETTLTGLMLPAAESHPDWEIGYMNFGEMFEWTYKSHPIFMSYALPKACPNPERSLLFVQEMLTNQELWQLFDMGIEGTHYEIDENGYYVSLNDPLNPGYLQGGAGITTWLYNPEFKVYSEDYNWVLDYNKKMDQYLVTNYFEGFPENYSAYSDKITAMSEINDQYTWPLLRGAVDDVEGAIADVNQRLDDAGRQEVVQSVIEQYSAYLDSLGVD